MRRILLIPDRYFRSWRLVFLGLFIIQPFTYAETPVNVEWKNNRVSVFAEKAPFSEILRAMAASANIELSIPKGLQEKVSIHLSELTLGEALQKILIDKNYVLIDGEASQPAARIKLILLSSQTNGSTQQTALSAADKQPPDQTIPASNELPELDPMMVMEKLRALAKAGDRQALAAALSYPDQTLQAYAFELLFKLDSKEAVLALTDVANRSRSAEIRLQALQLLSQADQQNDTILLQLDRALDDEDASIRLQAIQTLLQRDGEKVMTYLHQALRDPDPALRMQVIEQLAQRKESLSLLQEAASDSDPDVKALAEFWLEQMTSSPSPSS